MAYFYQHIKGLTSQATNWKINCETIDNTISTGGVPNTPQITFTKNSTPPVSTDLGYILTSKMENPRIEKSLYLNKGIIFSSGSSADSSYAGTMFTDSSHGLYLWGTDGQGIDIYADSNSNQSFLSVNSIKLFYSNNVNSIDGNPVSLCLISGSTTKGLGVTCFTDNSGNYTSSSNIDQTKLLANCPLYVHDYIRVRKNSNNANGYIDVDNYVQALYFNATSDKRAKTNITRSTFSALGLIKALPIYNFKYKSDNSDSIGIIAQEALNVSAGDFSLVTNAQASGENGNYMSVRESKLVYIAWKAIQEQQEIIDKQQEQINQLTELVNKLIQK